LSGKELFNYNSSLFVDDDGAVDEAEEAAMNAEMLRRKQAEELQAAQEAERIQEEQQRLFELQQIEFEARKLKEEQRRANAAAPNRATFVLAGVTVNQVVFEEEDEEDLAPFSEETLVEAEAPGADGAAGMARGYATQQTATEEEMAAYMESERRSAEEGEGEGEGDGDEDDDDDGGEEEEEEDEEDDDEEEEEEEEEEGEVEESPKRTGNADDDK
jgi:hypothetical protein